jgi:hypothetical protein
MGLDPRVVAAAKAAAEKAHAASNGVLGGYPLDQRGDAWETPDPPHAETSSTPFALTPGPEFVRTDYSLKWFVRRILVQRQPAVIGGPHKSMKTSLIVDLGAALASGTPFLKEFAVEQPRRVAIFSGESGPAVLKETYLRIARAKDIDPASVDGLLWGFELPQFTNATDLESFTTSLATNRVEVVIVDPAYLCTLGIAGPKGPQASNSFQMGPLYKQFADACLSVGATPILAAHFRTTRTNIYDPPELDDLAHAGIREFVRQWLLVGRREKYAPGTGQHRLWLSTGGSAGHSGLWSLEIDEGVVGEDFGGRFWNVRVSTGAEQRQTDQSLAEQKRKEKEHQRDREDDMAVMGKVDELSRESNGVAGYTKVRDQVGLSGPRMERSVVRLVKKELLEETVWHYVSGNGTKKQGKGLRRPSKVGSGGDE